MAIYKDKNGTTKNRWVEQNREKWNIYQAKLARQRYAAKKIEKVIDEKIESTIALHGRNSEINASELAREIAKALVK